MDLTPTPGVLLSTGQYQAFPYAASRASDGMVVGVWRSATKHEAGPSGDIKTMASISTDEGVSWAPPFVAYQDSEPLADHAPSGLVWDERSGRWLILVLRTLYKSAQDTKPWGYRARVLASTDARTWEPVTGDIPADTAGAAWWFVSDFAIGDDGEWIAAGYGRMKGATQDQPILMVSSDQGATWSAPIVPDALPAGIGFSEPQLVRHPDGWIMLVRGDDNELHQMRPSDTGWVYERSIIGGVVGMPEVAVTTAGVLVVVLRLISLSAPDLWHGPFGWAYSEDGGATWVQRDDFPDTTRAMMYAGLAPLRDGGLACVYAVEDDPKKPWASASVWTTRFVSQPLNLRVGFFGDASVPGMLITGALNYPIMRHTIDPVTGDEVVEEVRVKTTQLSGAAYDYELQQGQRAYYSAGDRRTRDVVGDILPGNMLIHPTRPELSLRLDVVSDKESREYDMDVNVQPVPVAAGTAGLQYPIVTSVGNLGAQSGTTIVKTYTLAEKARLELLLADLCPLFWSTHPGEDLPDWIRITKLSVVRFIDTCTSSYASWDDRSDMSQWRHWSMSWVAQPRPTAAGMPVKHRIRDVKLPIESVTEPYEGY